MSKKRTFNEANDDDQTNGVSDLAVFQPGGIPKHVKFAPLSNTTMQDLPIELLEQILVKVVTSEVRSLKPAKSIWKENADLVISRYRPVCWQWNNVLSSDFFRNEVHRTLDPMSQIRFDMLSESRIRVDIQAAKVTTLKDEIIVLSTEGKIYVASRSDMKLVNDVIPLPDIYPVDIAACTVSNCLFVIGPHIGLNKRRRSLSVLRIMKNTVGQFRLSRAWIDGLRLSASILSTSPNGNLIILSGEKDLNPPVVSIYDVNGSLERTIVVSSDFYDFRQGVNILVRSNGNLVLVSHNDKRETLLTEIATSGDIVRQYQSTLSENSGVSFFDAFGGIVITEPPNRMELLDSRLNLLDFNEAEMNWGQFRSPHMLHYNSEKNELLGIYSILYTESELAIFRLADE